MPQLPFIADLFSTTIIVLFMATACAGWGYATAQLCRLKIQSLCIEQLWLGFAVILAATGVINFFFRISWPVTVSFCVVGLIFLGAQFRKGNFLIKTNQDKNAVIKTLAWLVLFILFSLWAVKSMESPRNYDSGLYHFNSIRWINESALVPGLGNLHDRLAFNQSWFGLAAVLNLNPLINNGYAIVGLSLLSFAVLHIFTSYQKVNFPLIVLPIFLFSILLNLKQISSPSPDIPVNILQTIIATLLLQLAALGNSDTAQKQLQLTTIVVLCVSLITIKLSGAAFAAAALIVSLAISKTALTVNRFLILTALSAALYVPHLVRGYLLSGAPLFPSTFAAYDNFAWSMDTSAIKNIANWVYCWARSPGPDCMNALGSWEWINTWWQRFPKIILILISLSLSFLVIPFAFKSRFSVNRRTLVFYALATPSLISLVFWFFTAPDPRFLGSSVFVSLALTAATLASAQKKESVRVIKGECYVIPTLLVLAFSASSYSAKTALDRADLILLNGFQPIKKVYLIERTTASGLSVYTPEAGDQCFDSPLPCTPYFNEKLRLDENKAIYPKSFFTTQMK